MCPVDQKANTLSGCPHTHTHTHTRGLLPAVWSFNTSQITSHQGLTIIHLRGTIRPSILSLTGSEADLPQEPLIFITKLQIPPRPPRLQSSSGKWWALSFTPYSGHLQNWFRQASFLSFPPSFLSFRLHHGEVTQFFFSFFLEICLGEDFFHAVRGAGWRLKGPEMLGGVAGAALCRTAVSQALGGQVRQPDISDICCQRRILFTKIHLNLKKKPFLVLKRTIYSTHLPLDPAVYASRMWHAGSLC